MPMACPGSTAKLTRSSAGIGDALDPPLDRERRALVPGARLAGLHAERLDRVDAVDRLDQRRLALAFGPIELGQSPAEGGRQDADDGRYQARAEQDHQG